MMGDKRFKHKTVDTQLFRYEFITDNNEKLTVTEVVDLLNQLHEENIELTRENIILKEKIITLE